MELFNCTLKHVLTLSKLSKLANFNSLPISDCCFDPAYGHELASYIEFLTTQPKLEDFIATFEGKPYDEEEVRAYSNNKYPNNRNKAIKEFVRNRLGDDTIGRYFKGWEVIVQDDSEVQITNGRDCILFDSYAGENPYVLCNGIEIDSYTQLVDLLTRELLYK